jgi:hypothetical protein
MRLNSRSFTAGELRPARRVVPAYEDAAVFRPTLARAHSTAFERSPYCGSAAVTVNSVVLPICFVPFEALMNSST